ncbi:glycosyl hydrolase family 18 protein [Polyangium jinanense]|uniref:GH18 domain-containing protein n=1 Tax=Polyangium jinanense TaxID=2829994 RepID=A0A9X3X1I2_9BACT|nr:glycosyl hydrolase family 18 protein [Polyangium jinanense]MDC3955147.1 hypothetical protein [Polyangium jinanense]MDC3981085.1 hypothetical protein [Polyangium jinanense]
MPPSRPQRQVSRRQLLAGAAVVGASTLAYVVWSPGATVGDGRHDLGTNGIWMQHGWLGADGWFTRYGKEAKKPLFRDPRKLAEAADRLRRHRIRDVFPHLCPAEPGGAIAPHDPIQTERFLDAFERFRVMPWVGGVLGESARPDEPAWRDGFTRSIRALLDAHPRIAGIHVNIEPCPSGHTPFLTLLEELRAGLPKGKLLSVAAYPPPTLLHPFKEIHWDEAYFREVAQRVDQLAVMLYDTALKNVKLYKSLMTQWTREVLDWAGATPVLLGLPAYDDPGVGYHDASVENVPNALAGAHAALQTYPVLPASYQGIALYSEWEMTEDEWGTLRTGFLRPEGPLP